MPAGTHGTTRPRPLFIPSNDPNTENLEYSRLSVQPNAVQGTSSLSAATIAVLNALSFEKLGQLNTALCRLDQVRAGVAKSPAFRETLRSVGLGLSEESIENIIKAYSLDRHDTRVWWSRFIHDMSQMAGYSTPGTSSLMDPPSSPAEVFARSMSPSKSPEAPLPGTNDGNATEESLALIQDLATCCLERRINVEGAFADFERPGKFCKRVKRVTKCQFREVLNFILNGNYHLTDPQFALLTTHFDDGSGFVLYRDFIRAVDPYLQPGTGFSLSQLNSPPSVRRSNSPRRSLPSITGSSLSPGAPSSQLLGVQPMGPPECQAPSRIEVFERVRVDDIMAKLRHLCGIYSVMMVDHLRGSDRHQEGSISAERFSRALDALRVLRLNSAELEVLVRHYRAEVPGASHEPRVNYRQFCEDLQPTGPERNAKTAALRKDDTTSPFAVQELTEEEGLRLAVLHKRFGAMIQQGRIGFRAHFADFDRGTKTRNGSTSFNYTLNAGCISRSQFLQALKSLGLSEILSTEDMELLFKRYEREGEFNHLVFLRDLEAAEHSRLAELASPQRDRSPQNSFEIHTPSPTSLNASAACI